MDIKHYMLTLGENARAASRLMAAADTAAKNNALLAIAEALNGSRSQILAANDEDTKQGESNGLDSALLDRLSLTQERIDAMIEGLQQVAALPDPCGEITDMNYRPSGIQVGKMRVPLGVVGIIYESRPNVTIDAASLCLKSGNAAILRGGREAINSNTAIASCVTEGLLAAKLPATAIQVLATTDRAAVTEMVTMRQFVDVIVPRGGKGLIERIIDEATVPVIKHLDGVCHVYIDDQADLDQAFAIAVNAKTHRYGVCNAMETLLVAENIAAKILPRLAREYNEKGVELRGCENTRKLIPEALEATINDWYEEYLAPVLSIRVVTDINAAIDHINNGFRMTGPVTGNVTDINAAIDHITRYGSGHTEAIVTESYSRARHFMTLVDSSSVIVNASTRFADGFEYGLGAEIGISTDKVHARGPVGLQGLTSQKWIVFGDGHIRN